MITRSNRAFTLYELLVVVCIIAILAMVAVPGQISVHDPRLYVGRARAEMANIAEAMKDFEGPSSERSPIAGNAVPLAALTTPIPYLSRAPTIDPFKVRRRDRLTGTLVGNWLFFSVFTALLTFLFWRFKAYLLHIDRDRARKWKRWQLIALIVPLALVLSALATVWLFRHGISNGIHKQWRGKYLGYGYYADGEGVFILQSVGPDRVVDFDATLISSDDWRSTRTLTAAVAPYQYDPTNGATSSCDVLTVWAR